MKNFYQVGAVYIWQCRKHYPQFFGQETIVTSDIQEFILFKGGTEWGQQTDTIMPNGDIVAVSTGQLRPKNPPNGEKSIYDLFTKPVEILEKV